MTAYAANDLDTLLDEAMTPPPPPSLERTYFGEVIIVDAYACILAKGVGKILFDPTQHAVSQKCIAVKLGIQCFTRDGSAYTVDQDTITGSKEWREFTLPSVQRIGRDVKSLAGAWVQVKRKPTGERYLHKTSGEMRDKTALVFEAVYPDQEAMQVAADALYSRAAPAADPAIADAAASIRKTPEPVAPVTPAPTVDRAALAQFLPMLWQMHGQDKEAFFKAVIAMPHMAPFHTPDAPEMIAYLGENWMPF